MMNIISLRREKNNMEQYYYSFGESLLEGGENKSPPPRFDVITILALVYSTKSCRVMNQKFTSFHFKGKRGEKRKGYDIYVSPP